MLSSHLSGLEQAILVTAFGCEVFVAMSASLPWLPALQEVELNNGGTKCHRMRPMVPGSSSSMAGDGRRADLHGPVHGLASGRGKYVSRDVTLDLSVAGLFFLTARPHHI